MKAAAKKYANSTAVLAPVAEQKYEVVELARLKEHPENPNRGDMDVIKESISVNGFYGALIVQTSTGYVLAGNHRYRVLKERGDKTVPVIWRDCDETEARRILAVDNRSTRRGAEDKDLIAELLRSLPDLAGTGYTAAEFEVMSADAAAALDDLPELPANPTTQPGDLFALGNHRLICADALDPATYARLMPGEKAAMIFTDPPYGVDYKALSKKHAKILNDAKKGDDLLKFLTGAFRQLEAHAMPDAAFYIWHASTTREEFTAAMKLAGLLEQQYIIWVKTSFVLARADYHWAHEPCFYASKSGRTPAFYGGRDQATVWRIDRVAKNDIAAVVGSGVAIVDGEGNTAFITSRVPSRKRVRAFRLEEGKPIRLYAGGAEGSVWEVTRDSSPEHPNQKPVELARRAIENSSRDGEIVLDAFAGSGSTILAAQATGRHARAIEMDPAHCDAAIARWETLAGRKAELIEPTPAKRETAPRPKPERRSKKAAA